MGCIYMIFLEDGTGCSVNLIHNIRRTESVIDGKRWKIFLTDGHEVSLSDEGYEVIRTNIGEFKYPLLALSSCIINLQNIRVHPNKHLNLEICNHYEFYIPFGEGLLLELTNEDFNKIKTYAEDKPNFIDVKSAQEVIKTRRKLEQN